MRNFISYWNEHRDHLGHCIPCESVIVDNVVEHQAIFCGEVEEATPFSEGVLFVHTDALSENKRTTFIPWHQISCIDFFKQDEE